MILRLSKGNKGTEIEMIRKSRTPLQNNLVMDDEGEEEDLDPEIHCLGDTSSFPHLTQSTYEESLMDNQLNELSKGDKANDNPNRYNLRSKKKEGKSDVPDQPTREENPAKDVATTEGEENTEPPPVAKGPIPK
jgi:hypothetical protein